MKERALERWIGYWSKASFPGLVFAYFILIAAASPGWADQTAGAQFLDIPVGAGPAALGSAYSALATDAYAPVWNPAGLGYLDSTQVAAQHLVYLESIHYEYLSMVHPLKDGKALGFSMQYLGSGDMTKTNNDGDTVGDFSSYYSAYSFAYGQKISSNLSLGATGKWIRAKIDDVSADAFGGDMGLMATLNSKLRMAATLTNMGSKLKFLNDGDSLPLAGRLGAAYEPSQSWTFASDVAYRKTGLASLHVGGRWRPVSVLNLSLGYKTENLKELSPLAGLSTGIGLEVWGSELGYAWVPFGELGDTHYISFLFRFGEAERAKRNLIFLPGIRSHQQVRASPYPQWDQPEVQQLIELFEEDKKERLAQSDNKKEPQYEAR